eukprot:8669184-Lingulodinium_polyedra.AAC.1
MVLAWRTRFAKICGAAAVECVAERISERLSRESCSDMRLDMRLSAPLRAFRNSRTPRVSHHA